MVTESQVLSFDMVRFLAPLREELHAALERCLRHGTFVLGPEVQTFEGRLANYLRCNHAIGVSSGTDALLATFMALQRTAGHLPPLQSGDDVVTTPFSFISSATSVLRAGLRPVFADLQPGRLHPSVDEIEQAWTPRTRAVLVVHLFGEPLDLSRIKGLCRDRDAVLIEDCAQAIGATFKNGDSVGTAGSAGCFSFFPAKNLGALGDGGAVVTNHDGLATAVREKRQHGQAVRYQFEHLGGNFRLDALQAAMLGVLLPHLDDWIAERRRTAARYLASFAQLARVRPDLLTLPADVPGHSWNQFVVRSQDRATLRNALQTAGIQTQIYYPTALHQQGALAAADPASSLPLAERACKEVLALPIAPGLTFPEQTRVIEAVLSAW